MADRVPIGTIPGLVSQLVDVDILIATFTYATTLSTVFLRRTDNEAGDVVVVDVRNATGGSGDGITATLADGEDSVTETGTVAVAAGSSLYVRVTSSDANSMNLTGWVEVAAGAGATTALTNLARVKLYRGISGTGSDAILALLIASVSDEIQSHLQRPIVQETATDEKLDSIGDYHLNTRHYPIVSVSALTENDTALVEDTGFEIEDQDKERGQIARISGGKAVGWASGMRVVKVTYLHGYALIPDAIAQAATELVVWDYLQSTPGQARLGLTGAVLPTGGTSEYTTREALWEAQRRRLSTYRRAWM